MIKSFKYSLKIWLTTALTAPLILIVMDYVSTPGSFEHFEYVLLIYPIAVLAGLIFSCFTWMLFFIVIYNILKIYLRSTLYKLLIQATGLLLVFFTFIVLVALHDSEITMLSSQLFWIISSPYLICLLISIHFYKLPQPYIEHQENPTT